MLLRQETLRESHIHPKHCINLCVGCSDTCVLSIPQLQTSSTKTTFGFMDCLPLWTIALKSYVLMEWEVTQNTEILTKEEGRLWESGVLNNSTPMGLLRAVFFLNGNNFCLRGRDEHRNLRITQFRRFYNPHKYMYTENASKNRQGGLKQLRVENKSVSILATPEAGNKCHVHILDLYLSKLPPIAKDKDLFYLRPLHTVPKNPAAPWYMASPVGKNVLGDMKNICKEAGIAGGGKQPFSQSNWSNWSIRTFCSWCSRENHTATYWTQVTGCPEAV